MVNIFLKATCQNQMLTFDHKKEINGFKTVTKSRHLTVDFLQDHRSNQSMSLTNSMNRFVIDS